MNYWIWYATLKDIGPVKKLKLLEKFGTPEFIYNAPNSELANIEGITDELINNINISKDKVLINKYENYIKKNKIQIINILDNEYPEKLKNIYAPPITLFAKGNIELLNKNSIGIVGSREPSNYGIKVARNISKELSENGLTIISGMARGIDTYSHIGAIDASGETIAVLGSGLDIIYPKENTNLYIEILKKGLIISEYIVGTKPDACNFPQRNRIISGLSDGLLVVEAKKQSGTMITVDYSLEQGKEVYAVPGNIDSITSEGTNNLIKEGAKMVTSSSDILHDFHFYCFN